MFAPGPVEPVAQLQIVKLVRACVLTLVETPQTTPVVKQQF
jgi:hypothetical protein